MSCPRIQLTMSTPSPCSTVQIATNARTPRAALPSSSAVVIPSSERCTRASRYQYRNTRLSPLSVVSENDRWQRRRDEQQHDRCENADRRHEHRGSTLDRVLVQLLATRVADVLAEREEPSGKIDTALHSGGEQVIGPRCARFGRELGGATERLRLAHPAARPRQHVGELAH